METIFRTKVFGFSDILGEGWKIYKLGITKFILIALVVYLPISIFLYFFPMENILARGETSAGALLLSCVYSFVQIGIALVVYIAVAYLVEEIVQGRRTSWTAVLRYTFSRLPMVLIVDLLVGAIVAFGMLLLVIPGIIIGIYLVFTPAIVALRKIGFQAFQYSIDLVKGQWWRVFGISFGIGFIAAAFNYLLSWVIRTSAPYIGFGTILINLVSYLVTVLFSIFLVAFFLNQDYLKHPIESEPGTPKGGIDPQNILP